jgi:D-glycero-alpha-D-manno-heptose 1-phosphate guanylyltransferase
LFDTVSDAVILAGGLGTRLRPLVRDLPKPMADINGRPFLTIILDKFINTSVNHIVLAVGYKHELIINYFGDSYKGIKLSYSIESIPLGTAGAVKKASSLCSGNHFLLLNGDTYSRINIDDLVDYYNQCQRPVISVMWMEKNIRYGTVGLECKKVKSFNPKLFESGYINIGAYILNKKNLCFIEGFKNSSLENDFLPVDIQKQEYYAKIYDGEFIDIGIPQDYISFKNLYRS